ncbi:MULTISPECIES: thermonuclease family protein [unclassified Mycoplasma]|uniref:thermonuclease family protein n=1 Tax=unclassified Mycoplasma TaxID=2683645 RepID=UPI00211BBDBD|nr:MULTISPECIES: thermonuclease family protein [unclassified Mycoplasma]UUM20009.1 thermonuclease family protein [Mycoplasma sp. 1578d]UUM24990.1 thermonuclease family protein [Mycoplasma sp. 3686d]
MKILKKISYSLFCALATTASISALVSCSYTLGNLPNFREGSLDYSFKFVSKPNRYVLLWNEEKLDQYAKQGSENRKDKRQYESRRRTAYIRAWRDAFDQYQKDLRNRVISKLSPNLSVKSPLKNFSISLEQFDNITQSIEEPFLGSKAIIKFNDFSYVINNQEYLQSELPIEKANKLIKEIQTANKLPIKVALNYSVLIDGKQIDNFDITVTHLFDTQITKKLGDVYNNLNIKLAEFPKVNIDWNAKEIDKKYFDAEIVADADGDTFVVKVTDKHNTEGFKVGDELRIRLSGIDTPEKAVSTKLASPFEQTFARISSKFASKLMKTKLSNGTEIGKKLRVAFYSGRDSYDRALADVFFGDNYEYSYNLSIVAQGYTLPYVQDGNWENKITQKNTYENLLFPLIYTYFNKAIEEKKGFFEFFNAPRDVQIFVYRMKENGQWRPFWSKTEPDASSGRVLDFLKNPLNKEKKK